jgi:hypothetical protein
MKTNKLIASKQNLIYFEKKIKINNKEFAKCSENTVLVKICLI